MTQQWDQKQLSPSSVMSATLTMFRFHHLLLTMWSRMSYTINQQGKLMVGTLKNINGINFSIWGSAGPCVRPSVRLSVRSSVRPSVRPSIRPSVDIKETPPKTPIWAWIDIVVVFRSPARRILLLARACLNANGRMEGHIRTDGWIYGQANMRRMDTSKQGRIHGTRCA